MSSNNIKSCFKCINCHYIKSESMFLCSLWSTVIANISHEDSSDEFLSHLDDFPCPHYSSPYPSPILKPFNINIDW